MVDARPQFVGDITRRYKALVGQCGRCGHSAAIDLSALPQSQPLERLWPRLRCRICGSREISCAVVPDNLVDWFIRPRR